MKRGCVQTVIRLLLHNVHYVNKDQIDAEVTEVLDTILEVANKAKPLSSL